MALKRTRSEELFQQALKLFPGGVNSPVRAFRSVGGTPLFFARGEGAEVIDADCNRFIDLCHSWGPLILGHAHPAVVEAIIRTAAKGSTFGAPTEEENLLASFIMERLPFLERMRFVSSGTEAVMSAIRLARGATKRDLIIKFDGCYHGHFDSLLVNAGSGLATLGTSSSAGVPEALAQLTIVLPLNDELALEAAFAQHGDRIAGAIIEPVPANNGLLLQDKSFLLKLRELCTKHGSVLIFDEVISGFRIGFGGASEHYGIIPDLATYGKIIGGGMPVGAYGGKHDLMKHIAPEGNVYQAGTLSGNPVAMAAGLAQLMECSRPGFYEDLERKTAALCDRVNTHARTKGYDYHIDHLGSIFWGFFAKGERIKAAGAIDPASMRSYGKLHAALLERGVYAAPSGYEVGFLCAAHTETQIARVAEVWCSALDEAMR
ncbi:MAG: glutamate-1-semialdehyde 2,1-aminomutase [Flavobacteriales bacterium]